MKTHDPSHGFCNYTRNCIKDIVSAPMHLSPPIRRLVITEKKRKMNWNTSYHHHILLIQSVFQGTCYIISSTILRVQMVFPNTICLSGYLQYYIINNFESTNGFSFKLVVISCLVLCQLDSMPNGLGL
jgi:hypothetical protein